MRVEQVDKFCMGTLDDKVKAKRLQENLLRGKNLAGNFIKFLERKKKKSGTIELITRKITKKNELDHSRESLGHLFPLPWTGIP